jgi:hypothetical protein
MTESQRWPVIAGALSVFAAGLAGVPATATADEPPAHCLQWVWPGDTVINKKGAGTVLTFHATGPEAQGTTSDGRHFNAIINPNNFVTIDVVGDPQGTDQFRGAVDDFGGASGSRTEPNTAFSGWFASTPLKCDKRAAPEAPAPPKLGPTVDFSPTIGGLNVHITDRSGVTSQCTYNADGFTQSFRLEANKSTDLKIVPAIPKFDNWDISVDCDNGTSTKTTQFF